jgi:hypothetical protein
VAVDDAVDGCEQRVLLLPATHTQDLLQGHWRHAGCSGWEYCLLPLSHAALVSVRFSSQVPSPIPTSTHACRCRESFRAQTASQPGEHSITLCQPPQYLFAITSPTVIARRNPVMQVVPSA